MIFYVFKFLFLITLWMISMFWWALLITIPHVSTPLLGLCLCYPWQFRLSAFYKGNYVNMFSLKNMNEKRTRKSHFYGECILGKIIHIWHIRIMFIPHYSKIPLYVFWTLSNTVLGLKYLYWLNDVLSSWQPIYTYKNIFGNLK